jgi:hypothetical protein
MTNDQLANNNDFPDCDLVVDCDHDITTGSDIRDNANVGLLPCFVTPAR